MRYENRSFTNADIELDDAEFFNCKFQDCNLIYSGGAPPSIVGCSFDHIRVTFNGAAGNTLALMANLYSGGFRTIIEDTINNIRGNPGASGPRM